MSTKQDRIAELQKEIKLLNMDSNFFYDFLGKDGPYAEIFLAFDKRLRDLENVVAELQRRS